MKRYIPFLLLAAFGAAQNTENAAAMDRLLDRIVDREAVFMETMKKRAPLVETYIQEQSPHSGKLLKDHYFLGRLHFGDNVSYESLINRTDTSAATLPAPTPIEKGKSRKNAKQDSTTAPVPAPSGIAFLPKGFAQMAFLDTRDFSRNTYQFDYVGRDFLGDVRCLLFDVAPRSRNQPGKFVGRIWVEDTGNTIVRFDGSYVESPGSKDVPSERYFHFDSWRTEASPGEWVPYQVYVEEGDAFRAQTRLWDFNPITNTRWSELTAIILEESARVKDDSAASDLSPLESQRAWERQAEDNVLSRLERGGLLAPQGTVDDVLNTVVQNLIVAGKLPFDARCRVLLTTPFETFSIGHTIVISRGLIDVLPDEASLAMALSMELAAISLAPRAPTSFAFHNSTMLSDADLLRGARFAAPKDNLTPIARKAMELLRISPYGKSPGAGMFLKTLVTRAPNMPQLTTATLGNSLGTQESLARLADLAAAAPMVEDDKLDQISALPLGSRIKISPAQNRIEMIKSKPVSLLSAREKMAFEVTPFSPRLTRTSTPVLAAEK